MIEKLLENDNKQVQVVVSIEDLRTLLKEIQETGPVKQSPSAANSEDGEITGYLNRSKAAKLLNVHPITIYRWTKQNILKPIYINHRFLYPIAQLLKIKEENDFQL
ncbi:MAG: hypothetical protein MJZ34_16455 [Paludibacteraceae bacterium]|nr:hypothetical protein [Paludibacteraceae bacterium]